MVPRYLVLVPIIRVEGTFGAMQPVGLLQIMPTPGYTGSYTNNGIKGSSRLLFARAPSARQLVPKLPKRNDFYAPEDASGVWEIP